MKQTYVIAAGFYPDNKRHNVSWGVFRSAENAEKALAVPKFQEVLYNEGLLDARVVKFGANC